MIETLEDVIENLEIIYNYANDQYGLIVRWKPGLMRDMQKIASVKKELESQ